MMKMTVNFTDRTGTEGLCCERSLLEKLSSKPQPIRLAVILNNFPSANSRKAVALSVLVKKPEIKEVYGDIEVVQVSDVASALKLWQDSGFYRVAGFFIDPKDTESEMFKDVVNTTVGIAKISPVYSQNFMDPDGSVNQAKLDGVLADALYLHSSYKQISENMLGNQFLIDAKRLSEKMQDAKPTFARFWKEKYSNFQGYKILKPSLPSSAKKDLKHVSAECVDGLVSRIHNLLPSSESIDPSRRILKDPSDPRYASRELEEILQFLMDSEGGVTRFMEHATGGVVGLFQKDTLFAPEKRALFLKRYDNIEQVEAVFSRYSSLKQQRRDLEHVPLVVASLGDEGYAVLSEARVLTLTGDIAKILRKKDPDFASIFVNETVNAGIDRLVKHKNAISSVIDESKRARILQEYKLKLFTAWTDIHSSASGKASPLNFDKLYSFALEFLDYKVDDGWDASLFGSLMDYKVHNDGQATGHLHPTAEQLKDFLLREALKEWEQHPKHDQNKVLQMLRHQIKGTRGLLEYDGREGIVFEDYFHVINSQELSIPERNKPDYYRRFLSRLFGLEINSVPPAASRLWQSYFTMETFKSVRKVQRTLHYMAAGDPSMHEEELEHYKRQMIKAPWVAHMFYREPESRTDDFNKQLSLVRQLYDAQDQWGKLTGEVPKENNQLRWTAWLCSNLYLASIKHDQASLKNFEVVH